MSSLPTSVFSLRHKSEYLGYSRHHNKNVRSIVFGFQNHTDVQLITDQIIRMKKFPAICLDDYRRIVLNKTPPRKKQAELDVSELMIDAHTTEEFMIKNSVNGLDTCIVYGLEDLANSILISEYIITKINNVPYDTLTHNLERLFTQ